MRKLSKVLLFGSSIIMASTINASASIDIGAKIGVNHSNGKYSEKAADVFLNPARFSGGKGKTHIDLTVFAKKVIYEDDLLWIEGELDLSAFGSRFSSDTDAKDRHDKSTGKEPINNIKVNERFSGALVANFGKDLNDDYSIYGKLGATISSFRVDTEYDKDINDTEKSSKDTQKSYVIGGLIGAGVKRAVSDNASLMMEVTYNFTSSRKIDDFDPAGIINTAQEFSERTIRLDKAHLSFGLNISI